jgi:hypothetical protein
MLLQRNQAASGTGYYEAEAACPISLSKCKEVVNKGEERRDTYTMRISPLFLPFFTSLVLKLYPQNLVRAF